MDLKQWILCVLFVIHVHGTTGIDNKVYRCTEVADWKDAMKSCFDSGGTPISHQELTDNSNVLLKANQTFWTADSAVETHEHIDSQSGVDPEVSTECQFATVNIRNVLESGSSGANKSLLVKHFTLENPEFGDCKTERGYICKSSLGISIPHLYAVLKNWNNSKHKCDEMRSVLAKSGNHTRHGHIYGLDNSSDVLTVWLDQVRTYAIQVINSRSATDRLDIIKYGTFNLHDGFRLIPTGRGHNLTAICGFENACSAGNNLTTDCLEGYDDAVVGTIGSSTELHFNCILIASVSTATLMVSIAIGIIVWCRNVKRRHGNGSPSSNVAMLTEEPTVQPRVTSNSATFETGSDAIL